MIRTNIIINLIVKKFKYKKYLEIGCNRNRNFNKIQIFDKEGVDPKCGGTIRTTSDIFFQNNKKFFDIIFIDGLHHSDQVYKDVINSLNFLSDNGIIVVHDCNPESFESQHVPRLESQIVWNGDVWKTWIKLRHERDDLEMFVVDTDYGCGIIRKGKQNKIEENIIEFSDFKLNKIKLLNLKSIEEFKKWLDL